MIRGTTAQFNFRIPCDFEELCSARIMFWQPGNNGPSIDRPLPIVKILDQCSMCASRNEIYVILNQEETLRFSENRKAYVQLHATAIDGSVYRTKERRIMVYPVYDESIIGDVVTPAPIDGDLILLDGGNIDIPVSSGGNIMLLDGGNI